MKPITMDTNLASKINKARKMNIPHDTWTTVTAAVATPHSNGDGWHLKQNVK